MHSPMLAHTQSIQTQAQFTASLPSSPISSPRLLSASVRRSSPRTAKRPRTGPDRTDLGQDRSPGPASVLNGPVLVLNFSGKLRTSPGLVRTGLLPLFNRGSN